MRCIASLLFICNFTDPILNLMRKSILLVLLALSGTSAQAQDKGIMSGNFQGNFSIFELDSAIGAYESPQYLSEKSSAEGWLYLNYRIKGFNLSARYDLFHNSNLLNPTGSFTGNGLGYWQISKTIDNLTITAGSFYDQFGSGLVFRSYENRLIGIDFAMEGLHLKYQLTPNTQIKAFTGRQKGAQANRFGTSPEVEKGINAEHTLFFGTDDKYNVNLGGSWVNRTLTQNTMSILAAEINSYDLNLRFDPRYNVYAYNGYATFTLGNFSVFGEYVGKTKEAVRNLETGLLELKPGMTYYFGGSYSINKIGRKKRSAIGVNVQYRKIEDFQFRVSPYDQLLNGLLTYQPSLTRQAAYRLLARYNAPAQDYGEQGIQGDLVYTIKSGSTITLNYSNVKKLDGQQLFREYFGEYSHRFSKKLKAKVGLQSVFYDQEVYEGKDTSYPDVHTITPFIDITYKLSTRNSLRLEAQYLHTEQDLGSFVNAILELNMSPHYSFAVADMVNVNPVRHKDSPISDEIIHYYTIFAKYTVQTTSFTAAYVKQVEGVNCTGGICRLEPAFSGFRFTVVTTF